MNAEKKELVRIGIISDLHGKLPRAATNILKTCDRIICAGDFEFEHLLVALEQLGHLTAVRGNTDRDGRLRALPQTALIEVAGHLIYAIHDINDLDIDPEAINVAMVVHGHTHVPSVERKGKTLCVNPGSVTRPRNKTRPSVLLAELGEGDIRIETRALNS